MSFFRKLNRKQRRQFDKLEQEEKNQIIAHEISQKVSETIQKQIYIASVNGVIHGNELLYKKYVTAWDAAKYEEKRKIAKQLIEEIRMHHQKYIENQKNAENQDENKEENNNQEEK